MDWVVMDHHKFSFCEKKRTRTYTSLEPMTRYQIKQHLEALEPVAQFAIDAWTEAGTHYAAIIAVTPSLVAVQWLLKPHQQLLDKFHSLMMKLNTIKNRHALRRAGVLMPVINNTTRRSSMFETLDRYSDISVHIDLSNPKLLDVLLTPLEEAELATIYGKRLQSGGIDDPEASLLDARRLFDGIIKEFSSTSKCFSATASNVVEAPSFESDVVKVLSSKDSKLRPLKIAALKRLEATTDGDAEVDNKNLSFADKVLRVTSKPSAGLVFSAYRRAMHPTTLETLLFLEYNRDLWDAQLVAAALRSNDRNTRQRII
ncbi:hypothetical protein PHMEG_0009948 [Phytophthora megakarya]|uniref:Uncharacterized protein n=1 Tax=Phytophthora megakarya TaxID=4795 RepID=A0A225WF76_9STRA|nr:hypothetical protein PHMEG_0009948 [Phytophthora megakarya]